MAEDMELRARKLTNDLKTQLCIDDGPQSSRSKNLDAKASSDEEDEELDDYDDDDDHRHGSHFDGLQNKGDGSHHNGRDSKRSAHQDIEDDDDDENFGFDPERYVPFEEKISFSEQIKKTSREGLTEVVKILQEKCPTAIEDYGNDRLQIKVDLIERPSFDICLEIINENIKENL